MILKHFKNYRFHNALEAYEHGLQHGPGGYTGNLADRWNRMEQYLNGTLQSNSKWNQWGTKEGNTIRQYDCL